jgi:hypothetical protein
VGTPTVPGVSPFLNQPVNFTGSFNPTGPTPSIAFSTDPGCPAESLMSSSPVNVSADGSVCAAGSNDAQIQQYGSSPHVFCVASE